jgi:ATP-dependent Clp protease adaptor protein ClpS
MATEPDQESAQAVATPTTKPKPTPRVEPPKLLPRFNVVLLDDDDHTYDYVIEMMLKVFAYPTERGVQIAKTVDGDKRAIVYTAHKELAELKRDQILGYGADPRMESSHRSMRAVIEPADA